MNLQDALKYIKEAELHFKNGLETIENLRKIIESASENNLNHLNSAENLLEENNDKRENSDKDTESDKSEILPLLNVQTSSTDSYESNDGWRDTVKRCSKSIKDEIKKSPRIEENDADGFSDDTLVLSGQECEKTKSDSQKTIIVNKDVSDATDEDEKQAQEIISEWMIGDDSSESTSSKDVEISDLSDFDFELNSKEKSEKIKLKDLQVKIDKIDVEKLQKLSQEKKTSDLDEIDRLCNLSGLEKLKKSKKNNRVKVSKKRHNVFQSSNESSDDSTDSDLNILNPGEENLKFDDFTKSKLDDYLAATICEENHSDNECVLEESEDENCDENKKVKKKSDGNKKKLTKEEMEKRSWRNDPLLTSKLTSSSDDDDDLNDETMKQKNRKRKRSNSSDCILNNNDVFKKNKEGSNDEIILSSDDNTDSDIEIIPDNASFQGKRRNIRHVLSDENLSQLTQQALKDEQNRIDRLDSQKSASSSSILNNKDILISIDPKLMEKLKRHQIEGVKFMWDSCYESLDRLKDDEGSGCILAHCMGLGKTLQVITLIHTLFSCEATKTERVLVVCPLSTVKNWENEVDKTFHDIPHKRFQLFTILCSRKPSTMFKIKSWLSLKKSLLVMSYDSFATLTKSKKLSGCEDKEILIKALINPGPDLIVCDEGHLLRNANSLKTQALNRVKTKRRIVLTGTPLQNNLKEYYHMVQFVKPHLLGTFKEYKRNFVNPIMNGQYEDSTSYDIKTMKIRTHVLHKLLKNTVQRVEDTELKAYIPKMTDYAIFIVLSPLQIEMYNNYLNLTHRQSNQQQQTKFFVDFKILQLLSTHPYLLPVNEKLHCKKIKEQDVIVMEGENMELDTVGWWENSLPEDVRDKIEYGSKMVVFWTILDECEKVGDKILVFSQSLAELDTIEHFLKNCGTSTCPEWKPNVDYLRIDGTVLPEQRANMCDKFNCEDNKKIRLLLMSIKVGGLGLNLTAANRVVIMTVSWNPSYDTQSVFRTYRFGQKKPVYVYRLISMGTMEEKVYHRTINKLAIAHRVVDKFQVKSHYKNLDLDGMYSCRPEIIKEKSTFKVPEDSVLAKVLLKLDCIYKYHDHQALLANRPEDNLTESELAAAWEEFKNTQFAPQPPVMPQMPGPTFVTAYSLGSQTGPTIMQGEIRLNSIPGSSNSKTLSLINLPNKKNNPFAPLVNNIGNPARNSNNLIQLD